MKTHSIAGGGGLALHVEETGNPHGKPILFVHGFSQCRLAWAKQSEAGLARDFRIITMDIRGHGLSAKPRDSYADPNLWARDLDAVITGLALDKPVLVGWSYGGVIISDYIRVFGDQAIGGTQWVGAVPRLGEPLVRDGFLGPEFLALVPDLFSDDVSSSVAALRRFLRLCVHREPTPEDFYFFLGFNVIVPPHVRQGLLSRTVNNDDVFRRMRKPVSLVYGDADQIVSPRMCAHLEALAPRAAVAIYPHTGHMPFWEDAERFNRELAEFCHRA